MQCYLKERKTMKSFHLLNKQKNKTRMWCGISELEANNMNQSDLNFKLKS